MAPSIAEAVQEEVKRKVFNVKAYKNHVLLGTGVYTVGSNYTTWDDYAGSGFIIYDKDLLCITCETAPSHVIVLTVSSSSGDGSDIIWIEPPDAIDIKELFFDVAEVYGVM